MPRTTDEEHVTAAHYADQRRETAMDARASYSKKEWELRWLAHYEGFVAGLKSKSHEKETTNGN